MYSDLLGILVLSEVWQSNSSKNYFEHYPGVLQYMESTKQDAHEHGFVETIFGRRIYLDDIQSSTAARRAYAERVAINAPMQGTAADIIKLATVAIDKNLGGVVLRR